MTFTTATAAQLAAQAGRGSLRALRQLFDDIISHIDDLDTTDFALVNALTASAAEINRACDVSGRIVTLTADTAITEATHEGKTLLLGEVGGNAALAATLPAATGGGAIYRFVVSVVNTSGYTIKVTGNDVMYGNIVATSTGDTPDLAQPWPTAADSDTITLDGTTTGGVAIGDWIEVQDIAADKWAVRGVVTASGAEATPFSAAVP
jgi:hypothetical protein